MSSPEVIYACRWLIRDTFRQSMANYVFWVMLSASAIVILFCLSVHIEGGESLRDPEGVAIANPSGHMTLAFGAWRIDLSRDGRSQVHLMLLLLAEWVAGAGGTLLALVWTAGFVPEFLQPANATVLLSKPTPRWVLLLGKYLGVLAFVAFQATIFVVGTWLAFGLRTTFFVNSYLWSVPLLLLHFAAVYSFSVLLAVCTRSTLACVIGAVAFWFVCFGMNYGRHTLLALENTPIQPRSTLAQGKPVKGEKGDKADNPPDKNVKPGNKQKKNPDDPKITMKPGPPPKKPVEPDDAATKPDEPPQYAIPPVGPVLHGMVEAGYWIVPKPVDMAMVLHNALDADDAFSLTPELRKVQEMHAFHPVLSLLTSFLFAIAMIIIAARQLATTDY